MLQINQRTPSFYRRTNASEKEKRQSKTKAIEKN
jgi:hypothetical protein